MEYSNKAQEKIAQALVIAGVDENTAKARVVGFSGISLNHYNRLCPRCRGKMKDVLLVGKRKAMYCPNDRVTVPYPVNDCDSSSLTDDYIKLVSAPQKDTASVFAGMVNNDNNSVSGNRKLLY